MLRTPSGCCWSPCARRTGVNDYPEAKHGRIGARSSASVSQCLGFNGAASICLRKGRDVGNRDKGTHVLAPYIPYNCLNESTAPNGFAGCRGGAESIPCFQGRFMHPTKCIHPTELRHQPEGAGGLGGLALGTSSREDVGCRAQHGARGGGPLALGPWLCISSAPLAHRSWSETSAGLSAGATIMALSCRADE